MYEDQQIGVDAKSGLKMRMVESEAICWSAAEERHGAIRSTAEPPEQPATVGEREGLPSSNHVSTNSSGTTTECVTAVVKANENKRGKR
jgi:hypothetical protein